MNEQKIEIWKDVVSYEGIYEVSSFGRVKSVGNDKSRKEKILKPATNGKGYLHVSLCKAGKLKTFRVHRLVAIAFIPNLENKPEVNHKNGVKTDNGVDNLEWATHLENMQHADSTGLRIFFTGAGNKKSIPISQFTADGEWVKDWISAIEVKRNLGFNNQGISACVRGKFATSYGYIWIRTTEFGPKS